VLRLLGPLSPPVAQALPQSQSRLDILFEDAIARARRSCQPVRTAMIVSYVGVSGDAPGFYKVRFADADRGMLRGIFTSKRCT